MKIEGSSFKYMIKKTERDSVNEGLKSNSCGAFYPGHFIY
jgi:hypothetical protein